MKTAICEKKVFATHRQSSMQQMQIFAYGNGHAKKPYLRLYLIGNISFEIVSKILTLHSFRNVLFVFTRETNDMFVNIMNERWIDLPAAISI
jgi:hypothetical protein